jgi:PEP-CTERM motif
MAIRSSLFALVATACLLASYPASAVLITYNVDPGLKFCFDGDTCQSTVSLSGSFTTEIDPVPGSFTGALLITFPEVNIMLSNSSPNPKDNILPSSPSPVTLNSANAFCLSMNDRGECIESDTEVFFAHDDTDGFVNAKFSFVPGIETGGQHIFLPGPNVTEISTDGTIHPVTKILPEGKGFTSVPEPSSLVAMVSAMGLFGLVGWRRKSK